MPRVSVGLPVHNGDAYLREAIDSVLAQSFGDFELILSDNASTDGTQDICHDYAKADARVKVVRHPTNIGAAANYNYAFAVSDGEFFQWMAHDDVLGPEHLQYCLHIFETATDAPALVYPNFAFIDQASALIERPARGVTTHAKTPAARFADVLDVVSAMVEIYGLSHRATVARTRKIGGFVSSDFILVVEYALLGSIIRLDGEPQFFRRLHLNSSRQANKTEADILKWFDPNAVPKKNSSRRRSYNYYLESGSAEFVKAIMLVEGLSMKDRLAALRVLLGRRLRSKVLQKMRR